VEESEYELYNDDGKTPYAFEKGMYEIIEFESELKKYNLNIEIETELGENYDFSSKEIQLVLHNIALNPKKIKGYTHTWNKATKILTVNVPLNKSKEKNIKIKF
jgi:hypothetical protein